MPLFPVGADIPDYYTKPQWFIGRVKYCHEHKAADLLGNMGVEYYLPEQTVSRQWSDRTKKCIAVGLGVLGSARIELPLSYIETIEDKKE